MGLSKLQIRDFRNLVDVEIKPSPGLNWFIGENGAGKTSILEAIVVLARGRSFRTSNRAALIRHRQDHSDIVAHLDDSDRVLGVRRAAGHWQGRIAGRDSRRISEFARLLPLILIEPGDHGLIEGGPDQRRRFLDWLLFHVEPDYLTLWQRYARLLKQRNAALKSGASDSVCRAIEAPMATAGEAITQMRAQIVARLEEALPGLSERLAIRLPGSVELKLRSGHGDDESLQHLWDQRRILDRERGHTTRGPHRADLALVCGGRSASDSLSRGQQKLLAMLLQMAHLVLLDQEDARQPMLLLDDPVSELDQSHLSGLLGWLGTTPFQCWITAVALPPGAQGQVFHVEQGKVSRVV